MSAELTNGLMTRKAAAAYIGVGITKMAELTKAKKIPYLQDVPGGKMLFLRADLDAYNQSRRVVAPPPTPAYTTYRKRRVQKGATPCARNVPEAAY